MNSNICYLTCLCLHLLLLTGDIECKSKQLKSLHHNQLFPNKNNDDNDLQELFDKFFHKLALVIQKQDPFNCPVTEFNISRYGLVTQGFFKDFSLSYFSTLNFTKVKVLTDPLHFEINAHLNKFQALGKYKLNFDFLTMLPIFGGGNMGIAVTDLNSRVVMDIGKLPKSEIMQLKSLKLNMTVKDVKVDIKNILGNASLGTFLSNLASDILPLWINNISKLFKIAEQPILQFANTNLVKIGMSFDELVQLVKQFVQ